MPFGTPRSVEKHHADTWQLQHVSSPIWEQSRQGGSPPLVSCKLLDKLSTVHFPLSGTFAAATPPRGTVRAKDQIPTLSQAQRVTQQNPHVRSDFQQQFCQLTKDECSLEALNDVVHKVWTLAATSLPVERTEVPDSAATVLEVHRVWRLRAQLRQPIQVNGNLTLVFRATKRLAPKTRRQRTQFRNDERARFEPTGAIAHHRCRME